MGCLRGGGVGPSERLARILGQPLQRMAGLAGVKVEHHAVLVGRHRVQREHLRHRFLLEIEDDTNHAGLELAHPHAGDVGIVRPHLADQLAQGRVHVQPFDVDDQTGRVRDHEGLAGQGHVRFEGHAGVVGRRPDPHGHEAGGAGQLGGTEQQGPHARLAEPRTPRERARFSGRGRTGADQRVRDGEAMFRRHAQGAFGIGANQVRCAAPRRTARPRHGPSRRLRT
jgi:hypothetical protein